MMLTAQDLSDLWITRKKLALCEPSLKHRNNSSHIVYDELLETYPDECSFNRDTSKVQAVYRTLQKGPHILVCIALTNERDRTSCSFPSPSNDENIREAQEHDGHITTLLGFARLLGRYRPSCGTITLLFEQHDAYQKHLRDNRGTHYYNIPYDHIIFINNENVIQSKETGSNLRYSCETEREVIVKLSDYISAPPSHFNELILNILCAVTKASEHIEPKLVVSECVENSTYAPSISLHLNSTDSPHYPRRLGHNYPDNLISIGTEILIYTTYSLLDQKPLLKKC